MTSGPSRVLTEIVNRLSKDIFILVLSPKRRRDRTRTDVHMDNLEIQFQSCGHVPGVPGSDQWIECVRMNRRLQKLDFQPDLVWIHSAPLHMAYRYSKFRNIPSVTTVHGIFGDFYRSEARRKRSGIGTALLAGQAMLFQRCELNSPTVITTYSTYLRDTIKTIARHSKVVVIPNGVNLERFKLSKTSRDKIIVYVGRMATIKGVHVLIKSMKTLEKKHPDWSLWLVGGAFDQPRSFFEKFMTPSTRTRIRFLGAFPNEKVPEILNKAGIFVMPTLRDGFEIAMMEAMATGIPCVTTAVYERTELYGGYAETVPPGDPKALADRLDYMIRNYSTLISEEATRKRVLRAQEFNWNSIAKRYEDLFRKCIECRG